jgi:hypothetical protein
MEKPSFDFTLLSSDPSSTESFVYHLEELKLELANNLELLKSELLVVKSTNDWLKQAQQRPIPAQLFSEFYEVSYKIC